LAPEKGISPLLQAWKHHKNTPLHIVGDGVLKEQLEVDAASFKLSSIKFMGTLGRSEVYEQMKKARVLVFPSQSYETFGMTIIEAYACGLPVIASRLGAMQEIVHDGRTGLHFTPGDADDLARKVEWAWAHPDEMREMGINARAEFVAKYTAEKNYEILIAIYESVINNRKALSDFYHPLPQEVV
jgi:glycosyltransferase involved in cell wall biosynthesis